MLKNRIGFSIAQSAPRGMRLTGDAHRWYPGRAGMNSNEHRVTTIPLPDHLRRFPCMRPWIGSRYRDERHKRLLVIGESHSSAARLHHPRNPEAQLEERRTNEP